MSPMKPHIVQPTYINGLTAVARAKEQREYADQARKSAQQRIDGIEALIASEKELAAADLQNAEIHELRATLYLAHIELIDFDAKD